MISDSLAEYSEYSLAAFRDMLSQPRCEYELGAGGVCKGALTEEGLEAVVLVLSLSLLILTPVTWPHLPLPLPPSLPLFLKPH